MCVMCLLCSVPVHRRCDSRLHRCEVWEDLQGLLGLRPGAGGEHGQLPGERHQRKGGGGGVQVGL